MIRRRRPTREIPFSFDSFLDVVANVVGIIIRLILVVWVGARSYSSIQMLAKPRPRPEAASEARLPADPLEAELSQHRQELAAARARLLEQLRQIDLTQADEKHVQTELTTLLARDGGLEKEKVGLEQEKTDKDRKVQTAVLSMKEIQQRHEKLLEEIRAMEKLPPARKVLRYRTPVSQPVHTEEFFFECRNGRVAFIDVASLLEEVRQTLDDKSKTLRQQWQVTDTTPPVGAFRLRYVVERERAGIENVLAGALDTSGGFRFGVSEWVVEPVAAARGETAEEALAPNSEFRRLADTLDAQAVVTFWVYPDSFQLFRKVRDYLYDRDVSVAGRPLPEGAPIACSRKGSASRAQ